MNKHSILPTNSTNLERSLEEQTMRIDALATPIRSPFNPEDCPPELLDLLANAWAVDYWNNGFNSRKKRDVLSASFSVHQIKGTPESIRHAIRSAGYGEIKIVEGIGNHKHDGKYKHDGTIRYSDGTGHWAKYSIIMQYQLSVEQAAQVRKIIDATAPARNILVEIRYIERKKHNGTIKYDGKYTYGAN